RLFRSKRRDPFRNRQLFQGAEMSKETSKARARRFTERLYDTVFVGHGIDIGCGDDPILPDCIKWDLAQGDAHDLSGIPNDSLDYVYSSHCLEHLADPERAIRRW